MRTRERRKVEEGKATQEARLVQERERGRTTGKEK